MQAALPGVPGVSLGVSMTSMGFVGHSGELRSKRTSAFIQSTGSHVQKAVVGCKTVAADKRGSNNAVALSRFARVKGVWNIDERR